MATVLIIRQDSIFKSPWSKFDPDYEDDYKQPGLDNFESSFIQFCILYGFIIWFVKFMSVIAMRLKLQYNAFVLPVYLSIVGLFLIYHFYELEITLFDIGNGETEFHSGQFFSLFLTLFIFYF